MTKIDLGYFSTAERLRFLITALVRMKIGNRMLRILLPNGVTPVTILEDLIRREHFAPCDFGLNRDSNELILIE